MKVQCERCKEIVPIGAFRASSAGIDITCSACGEAYFVAAAGASQPRSAAGGDTAAGAGPDDARGRAGVQAGPAPRREAARASAAPVADETGEACPKCGAAVVARAAACARCGLAVERFAGYRASAQEPAPAALVALWETCRDRWDEPAAHAAFLETAGGAGAYRYAAARYRAALRDAPGDPVARARLDEVERRVVAALSDLRSAPGAPERERGPMRLVMQALVVVMLVACLGLAFKLVSSGGDAGLEATNPARVDSPASRGGM